jgi:acyl-CoA reductase-like NAD-dependent aldehyde dehydrogenase
MRERRDELAALECFEAAKPWDQADGDVCEAIDFCEYYGREVLRLAASSADLSQRQAGGSGLAARRSSGSGERRSLPVDL